MYLKLSGEEESGVENISPVALFNKGKVLTSVYNHWMFNALLKFIVDVSK